MAEPCGCRVRTLPIHCIAYCPMHAAAPEMYLTLREIAQWRGVAEQNKDDALLYITKGAMRALDKVEGRT